jgi:hypothetical protein
MATKNIVASKIASRCTVQLSYAIGKADPTSLMLDLHGTGLEIEAKLDSIEIYRKFAANVGLIKAELTSFLNNLKGQGARISLTPAHKRVYKILTGDKASLIANGVKWCSTQRSEVNGSQLSSY